MFCWIDLGVLGFGLLLDIFVKGVVYLTNIENIKHIVYRTDSWVQPVSFTLRLVQFGFGLFVCSLCNISDWTLVTDCSTIIRWRSFSHLHLGFARLLDISLFQNLGTSDVQSDLYFYLHSLDLFGYFTQPQEQSSLLRVKCYLSHLSKDSERWLTAADLSVTGRGGILVVKFSFWLRFRYSFFILLFILVGIFEYYFVVPTFVQIIEVPYCGYRNFRDHVVELNQQGLVCTISLVFVLLSLIIVMVIDCGVRTFSWLI